VSDWLVWLIIAGVLALAEVSTLTFVFSFLAAGAAAASLTAALGGEIGLQVVVAIGTSAVLLAGVRPVVRRHALSGSTEPSGAERLVGMEAVVLNAVDARSGLVRLNGGEWTARAFQKEQTIPAGTVVRVMSIDGATAVVWHEK
jgi:membrane protein implicated in regulation of membrane protease activity